MSDFQISVRALRAVYSHAADGDVRYYLNGVYVDTENGNLVATDGHRMMVVKMDRVPGLRPLILPAIGVESILKQLKGAKYDDHVVLVKVEDRASGPRTITLTAHGVSMTTAEIDGKYPDYQRILPKKVSGVTAQFNYQYLHEAQQALRQFFGYSPKNLAKGGGVFVAHNGTGPAVVYLPAGKSHDAFVIVMPLRADGSIEEAQGLTAALSSAADPE